MAEAEKSLRPPRYALQHRRHLRPRSQTEHSDKPHGRAAPRRADARALEPGHGDQCDGRVPRYEGRDTGHAARGGGSIINISSICGIIGSHANAAYHASKGAVRIFSKAAAIQYAPDKIRVNSVHPGFVDTPMTKPGHSNPEVAKQRMEATPLGRFGTPADIAAGCLYLASDEASWVTGSELVIDGGMTAN